MTLHWADGDSTSSDMGELPVNDGPRVFFPSLTQLRAFSEAARLGGISRAAEELRRSQSAVTQAVQKLEEDLGETLFTRTNAGCYLTNTGKILHRRAEACFARLETGLLAIMVDGARAQTAASRATERITRAQILSLTAVQEFGSFAQAARHSNVSVTSLHRSARMLEQQVGVKLLKNTAQGVITSEAGTRLANSMRLAMRELEWAAEEIDAQTGRQSGRLLIGALMLAGTNMIALGLDGFIKANPDVRISIVNGTYDVLLSKLRGGSLDFLIGLLKTPAPAGDVVEEALGVDPYMVVAGRQNPVVRKRDVTIEDLAELEWIAPPVRRASIEALFRGRARARFNVETHSIPAIFLLLASGNRASLLTRAELALDRHLGNQLAAVSFEVTERPGVMGVTTRRSWEPTRLQQDFLSFLRSQASVQQDS